MLVVNAGSGSIKTASFRLESEPQELCRDVTDAATADAAVTEALRMAERYRQEDPAGFGIIVHRIVHGGAAYAAPTRLTPAVLNDLRQLVPLAPNHLPTALALVDAFSAKYPASQAVACFDTGFHASLPAVARRLPIPAEYDTAGVRRYGFHGLSCASVIDALRRGPDPDRADARLVIAHLGNGCSLTATHHGRSVDTTMGFTPFGGVMMSTRSGDLDPGVLSHLARTWGFDGDALEEVVSHRSGLLGVSTVSSDMRTLLGRTDENSRLAVEMFVYQVAKSVGALAVVLGGIDGLVFTGGIGEHAAEIRRRVCERLEWMHIPHVTVVPADEELAMARAAVALLKNSP
jgi:acetate kinase